jgi:hypothetical protein
MQSLIIVTFSRSSDAAVMCFVIALHSFVVRSAFDSTFRLVVAEIYWRRVSNDGSYTCDGIPMDSLIKAAARALAAAGDPDRGLVADVECERQEPLAPFSFNASSKSMSRAAAATLSPRAQLTSRRIQNLWMHW